MPPALEAGAGPEGPAERSALSVELAPTGKQQHNIS